MTLSRKSNFSQSNGKWKHYSQQIDRKHSIHLIGKTEENDEDNGPEQTIDVINHDKI